MITQIALPNTRLGVTPLNMIDNIPIILKCQLIETTCNRIDSVYSSITLQSKQQSTLITNIINTQIFRIYDKGEDEN